MSGYEYSKRTLNQWNELPSSTYLWDLNKHMESQINYWRARAKSAEKRMLEHECQEDN